MVLGDRRLENLSGPLYRLYYRPLKGPAKLRDSIRFRIVRPIRDSIRSDGPIRNFRIVRAVNRHS